MNSQRTSGLVRDLISCRHGGFRTFPPLVGGLGNGLAPVVGSVVALIHWLSPALAATLRIGFVDCVAPVGAGVRRALVWGI